jgi:L-rhamnonate dehydratase
MDRRTFLRAIATAPALGFLDPFDAAADLPKATITRVRIYRPPNLNPLFNQSNMVCTVETDIGITGIGEGGAKDTLEQCAGTLIGKNPFRIEAIWQEAYIAWFYPPGREKTHALGALDLALWDIKGKALQQPVWKLLGGRHRDRLRVYASNMFQFTPEATADRVSKAKDEGFTAAKFGWEPFGRDPKSDCAYLAAMHKAAGDDFDLMLDVGLVWDATTTIQRAKLFEPFNLFWIEEPLPPDDLEGYARVSRAITQRLAAGEEECTLRGFMRLIDQGGIGLAQIDVTRCGLTQSMQIAAYAASRGVPVANHNFTTDINTAASLHFLAAVPNALVLEYCVEPSEISRRLIRNQIRLEDGQIRVPEEPGLGVEPDMAVVEKYLMRD